MTRHSPRPPNGSGPPWPDPPGVQLWRRGLIYGIDADEVNPEVPQSVEEPVQLGLVGEVPGQRGLAGPRVYFKLFEHAGEAVAGLVADGKTTPAGVPNNPLQLGATFWHFRHQSRVTSTPIWVQNLMLPPLWALAKVFGVRPYYDRWDSRT